MEAQEGSDFPVGIQQLWDTDMGPLRGCSGIAKVSFP